MNDITGQLRCRYIKGYHSRHFPGCLWSPPSAAILQQEVKPFSSSFIWHCSYIRCQTAMIPNFLTRYNSHFTILFCTFYYLNQSSALVHTYIGCLHTCELILAKLQNTLPYPYGNLVHVSVCSAFYLLRNVNLKQKNKDLSSCKYLRQLPCMYM